ncbi:hypothetical protein ACRALDRAFT_1091485 [Sodiomyces alcalophilus JCM 7366]|uniref:uncharacterized protein n=1 Tax=Sodiomyces alcalophilus JCM 7366 TaxID=591952 RepID=UPI0039B49912
MGKGTETGDRLRALSNYSHWPKHLKFKASKRLGIPRDSPASECFELAVKPFPLVVRLPQDRRYESNVAEAHNQLTQNNIHSILTYLPIGVPMVLPSQRPLRTRNKDPKVYVAIASHTLASTFHSSHKKTGSSPSLEISPLPVCMPSSFTESSLLLSLQDGSRPRAFLQYD